MTSHKATNKNRGQKMAMISAHGTAVNSFKSRKLNDVGPYLNFLEFGILNPFPCAVTIVKV